jgi:hypothetical protein
MQSRRLLSLSFATGALIVAAGCSSGPSIEEHTDQAEDALTIVPIPRPAPTPDFPIIPVFRITQHQRDGIGRIFHTGVLMGLAEADLNYRDVASANSALGYAQTSVPDTRWAISAPGYSWPPIAPTSPSYATVIGWRNSLHNSIATYSTYADYYDFGVWLGFAEVDCAHGAAQTCMRAIDVAISIADRLNARAPIGVDILRDIRIDASIRPDDIARTEIAKVRQRYEDVVYASAEFTPNRCAFPTLLPDCGHRVEGYAFMVAPGTRCPALDVPSLNATWYADTGLPIENDKGPFGAFAGESSMVTPSKYRDSPLCAYTYAGLRNNVTFATVDAGTRTPALVCNAIAPHPEVNYSAAAYLLGDGVAHCKRVDVSGDIAKVECPQLKGGCDTCVR